MRVMSIADKLVLQRQRHLKWRALDPLELILMIICGLILFGFSLSVSCDIATRILGTPWLWLQEVTSTLFVYGIFIGASVATPLLPVLERPRETRAHAQDHAGFHKTDPLNPKSYPPFGRYGVDPSFSG
jgi:hypothetical protein